MTKNVLGMGLKHRTCFMRGGCYGRTEVISKPQTSDLRKEFQPCRLSRLCEWVTLVSLACTPSEKSAFGICCRRGQQERGHWHCNRSHPAIMGKTWEGKISLWGGAWYLWNIDLLNCDVSPSFKSGNFFLRKFYTKPWMPVMMPFPSPAAGSSKLKPPLENEHSLKQQDGMWGSKPQQQELSTGFRSCPSFFHPSEAREERESRWALLLAVANRPRPGDRWETPNTSSGEMTLVASGVKSWTSTMPRRTCLRMQ